MAISTGTLAFFGSPATAQTHLTTMVFQGVQNLPLLAAQQKGFFARRRNRPAEPPHSPSAAADPAGGAAARITS